MAWSVELLAPSIAPAGLAQPQRTEIVPDHIFVIRNVLSRDQCDSLIAQSERLGYDEAPVGTPEVRTSALPLARSRRP